MLRKTLVLCLAGLLILIVACKPKPEFLNAVKTPPATQKTPSQTAPPELPKSQVPEINQTRDLLAASNYKEAIRLIESYAQNHQPLNDELKFTVVDAHRRYLQTLNTDRTSPREALMKVLYCHAARILELVPGDPEAKANRESAMTYYKEHQLPPPVTIDPIIFLDDVVNEVNQKTPDQSPSAPGASGPTDTAG
jgi:hypothetical protein